MNGATEQLLEALRDIHRAALRLDMPGIGAADLRAYVVGRSGMALREWQESVDANAASPKGPQA